MAVRTRTQRWRFGSLVTVLLSTVLISACGALDRIGEPVVAVEGGDPRLGRDAIREYGCISCHSIPGVTGADAHVGPPLDNFAERRFLAGRVPNDADTLILFLMDPKYVDPQSAMPVTGLTEEDARHIAAYLYTLTED
jgi:cytochrome c